MCVFFVNLLVEKKKCIAKTRKTLNYRMASWSMINLHWVPVPISMVSVREAQLFFQCHGSGFSESGSGYGSRSSFSSGSKSGSGSSVLMTKNWTNTAENFVYLFQFVWSKIAIYLSLGLIKTVQATREAFSPSKANIQHFNLIIFPGHFCHTGAGSGSTTLFSTSMIKILIFVGLGSQDLLRDARSGR